MEHVQSARNSAILTYVARSVGSSSVGALLDRACTAPTVPAVCVECFTLSETPKLALKFGHCTCCHGQHVQSVLVVADIL